MRAVPIVLAMALLMAAPARALAGYDGQGAAAGDVKSVSTNPAATLATGGRIQGWASISEIIARLHYHRAHYYGTDPNNDPDRDFAPENAWLMGTSPAFAVRGGFRGDHPDLGWGVSLAFPTGSHLHLPSDAGSRYHIIDGQSLSAYLTPAFSFRPMPRLRAGVGVSLVYAQLTIHRRIDLAPSIAELLGPPAPYPETGLLMGDFSVKGAGGFGYAGSAGVIWEPTSAWSFGLSGITPCRVTMRGTSTIQPSLDFAVTSRGHFAITRTLPPFVNVGAAWHSDGPWDLSLEGQWAGWSSYSTAHVRITGATIKATTSELQSLLNATGLSNNQLVDGVLDQDKTTIEGDRDAVNVVLGASRPIGSTRVRLETGWFQSTVPERFVTPANPDFDKMLLGGSVQFAPVRAWADRLQTQVGAWQFITLGRTVTNSAFGPTEPPASELDLPTGNGRYDLVYTKVGVEGTFRF